MAVAGVSGFFAPTLLALKQAGLEYLLADEARAHALPMARVPQGLARDMQETGVAQALPREASSRQETQAAAPAPAEWPVAWQAHLRKTRAAPVVWTYWELGLDVCGTPDPKRRELFQELLKDLAHPPGTHSFWPVALPGEEGQAAGKLEANVPIFWEGVRLLHSRAVMLMGSQALRALALSDRMRAMRPFQQRHYQGRLLIVLPSPDALIQEARRIQALREFLRQALAPFV